MDVVTNVLEGCAACSVFSVEVTRIGMWLGYVGKMGDQAEVNKGFHVTATAAPCWHQVCGPSTQESLPFPLACQE